MNKISEKVLIQAVLGEVIRVPATADREVCTPMELVCVDDATEGFRIFDVRANGAKIAQVSLEAYNGAYIKEVLE